jgi:hypothetical protein
MQEVNYIHHMENTMVKFGNDQRISPWHISMYLSLFQIWNSTRFKKEISIRRDELMSLSKIGSTNTYSKCLKQLNDWGYLKYHPSKSRFIASKVHMYRFDTTRDTSPDTTRDTSCDTSCDTTCDTTSVHLVRPFLNNTKHIVNYNKQKENNNKLYKTKEGEEKKSSPHPSQNKNDESSFRKDELHSPKKASKNDLQSSDSSKSKKPSKGNLKSPSSKKKFVPPELQNVKTFFHENKSSYQVAEMFFNHFESNGWKVGGKAPMKNWNAAAKNWIMRDEKYQAQNRSPAQQRLHVNENKDYSEPL